MSAATSLVRQLDASSPEFARQLLALREVDGAGDRQIEARVRDILDDVQQRGDAAVLQYTAQFDRLPADSINALEIPAARLQASLQALPEVQRAALQTAADRIRLFAERQVQSSWEFTDELGNVLGERITPLDRVGLYVPGGKAAYPSSVLMNAVPAKVAGVAEVIMTVPTPDGVVNELVLAAAALAGVDRVFTIGGAQAVAALAFGTETIPAVDKIVGPGNIYVATAKRMVFGTVGIDMIAGPSEILVVCDGGTDADWIARDLFSQAEHDEDAQAILISPDTAFLQQVADAIARLLPAQPRAEIIEKSLAARGALILVADLDQAAELVNDLAPEHLELSLEDPEAFAKKVRHAGAIFQGRHTAEALGDYCAGPNHVLPTSRTARFASPLGVYDFQKRSSIIRCSESGSAVLGEVAGVLADAEGLSAHAQSARSRVPGSGL